MITENPWQMNEVVIYNFVDESKNYLENTNAQVLIFGSSHAHRHYVPEVFEKTLKKTTYNAGAEGQQLLYHLAMQQMIVKRVKPEVIIFK